MVRRFAIGLAAALLLLFTATAASAQTSYGAPAPGSDNQTVTQGDSITITFNGLHPNEGYDGVVTSDPIDLGVHQSDSNGVLSFTFSTAPLAPGSHTLTVTSTVDGSTAVAHFTVVAAGGGAVTGSAIPRTGSSSTVPMTSIALSLLAVGGLIVFAARRRRAAPVA